MKYQPIVELLVASPSGSLLLNPPSDLPIELAIARLKQGIRRVLQKSGLLETVGVTVEPTDQGLKVRLVRRQSALDTYTIAVQETQDDNDQ